MPAPSVSDTAIPQHNRVKAMHNAAATQIRSVRPDAQLVKHPFRNKNYLVPFAKKRPKTALEPIQEVDNVAATKVIRNMLQLPQIVKQHLAV